MMDSSAFKNVKPFDFRQICRLPSGIDRKLEGVNSRFAQNLVEFFRAITGESKEEISVSSYKMALTPVPVEKSEENINFVFKIEPDQLGRLSLDSSIATGLLRYYLGYPAGERISPVRPSKIEESALLQLVRGMAKELQNAWAEDLRIGEIAGGYGKGSEDRLVASKFFIKSGISSGEAEVCYPLTALDMVSTQDSSSKMQSKQDIKKLIEDSEVELTCVLGKVRAHCSSTSLRAVSLPNCYTSLQLTLSQIAELKTGDVILMDKEGDPEATILIQEKNKFRGVPGIFKDKIGVKITSNFSCQEKI